MKHLEWIRQVMFLGEAEFKGQARLSLVWRLGESKLVLAFIHPIADWESFTLDLSEPEGTPEEFIESLRKARDAAH